MKFTTVTLQHLTAKRRLVLLTRSCTLHVHIELPSKQKAQSQTCKRIHFIWPSQSSTNLDHAAPSIRSSLR
ncbi:hypothetical protein SUGI_0601020 [Cryptomeria japonica]|nr:hypothetical protein SUGI_0601020 [Cryptomeria japonica]